MIEFFASLKSIIKVSAVRIDNNVFRLHYKLTFAILIAFSLIATKNQYIGDPIDCIVDEIPHDIMDAFCWIHSTFTVPKAINGRIGIDVVQPGVRQHISGEDEVKYHQYYQWVCFVLFFQALLFYIPHYFWKSWEGGRIAKLSKKLNVPLSETEEETTKNLKTIADFFMKNQGSQNWYAYRFFFCELLNVANVIGQIFFMDYFLQGEFSTYGWDVFTFTGQDPEERVDPMAEVFPKVTKCTFHKYGASGTVQKFDGLCVLPVNIFNEKIYVILWFWFLLLSIVTSLAFLYRLATIYSSSLRRYKINSLISDVISKEEDKQKLRYVVDSCCIGDWIVLYQLGVNVDRFRFKDLIDSMYDSMHQS